MEHRDVRVPLFDILVAAEAVGRFIDGHSMSQYGEDLLLRSAVERQLLIVGEAMARVLRIDPLLTDVLSDAANVIGLRNVLAHAYDRVIDAIVWEIATRDLPRLASEVRTLLDRMPPPTDR